MPIELRNTWCSWVGLPTSFPRDQEPSWLHSSVLELRCHRTMVHPISFARMGWSRGFNRNYKVGREIIMLQIVVSVNVTFTLTVDKTFFMWLIHTCQFSWDTELTCFTQENLDLEMYTWNICLTQPAFILKMSVLHKQLKFGEVSCLIKIYWSKCKSHV